LYPPLEIGQVIDGLVDVGVLGPLITAAKQQDNLEANHAEIDAIPRTVVYPQFRNAVPQRLAVTEVPGLESGHPGDDPRLRPHVSEVVQPFGDNFPAILGAVSADDVHA